MGFNKQKLKVNLKLAINRLKLLEKKKTELAQKARKEIADYINNGKDERARIRVEHIIREDYLVEAMEMLELYCDLLLARFGLIETQQYCEEGMIEAVTTLMWSAPRLQTDVQELRVIADQLGLKYGKKFAHEASINANSTVNDRLILKLSPKPPPKSLVENYLIEIARSHNVAFEPDRTVFLEEDDLPEYDEPGPPKGNGFGGSGSGGGGGGTGRIGFEGIAAGYDAPSISNPQYASLNYPPSHGSAPPYPVGPPGNAPPSYPEKVLPPYPGGPVNNHSPTAPPAGPQKPPAPTAPTPAPRSSKGPSFPDLPSVPTDLPNIPDSLPGANSAGGEDVDFDDLTRRFEDLKKKK